MRRQAFLLALLCLCGAQSLSAQSTASAPATTIIFVRHAEAGGGDPRDPTLTPAGEARAQALVKALSGAGVAAVYTSQFNRTKQTGDAVAKANNVTAVVVPVAGATLDADAGALIARIVKENPGRTVLVAGHSNTVPLMVKKASGVTVDAIPETEFDRMFIVTIRDGVTSLIQAKY
jgi:broad specificity phosphatase PhoE